MTNNNAQDMRKLIEAVEVSHSVELDEAKPFGIRQQLTQMFKAPFSSSGQRQYLLNQYANSLYSEWIKTSQAMKSRTGNDATARDFIQWYSTSPKDPSRVDPISSGVMKALMQKLGIGLDNPLSADAAGELCKSIAAAIASQTSKISLGLIKGATAAEEQQVYDTLNQIDDYLIRNEKNLSLRHIYNFLVKQLGADNQAAILMGWRKMGALLRSRAPAFPITPFLPNNSQPLDPAEKTALIDILAELLFMINREIERREVAPAVAKKTRAATGTATSAGGGTGAGTTTGGTATATGGTATATSGVAAVPSMTPAELDALMKLLGLRP